MGGPRPASGRVESRQTEQGGRHAGPRLRCSVLDSPRGGGGGGQARLSNRGLVYQCCWEAVGNRGGIGRHSKRSIHSIADLVPQARLGLTALLAATPRLLPHRRRRCRLRQRCGSGRGRRDDSWHWRHGRGSGLRLRRRRCGRRCGRRRRRCRRRACGGHESVGGAVGWRAVGGDGGHDQSLVAPAVQHRAPVAGRGAGLGGRGSELVRGPGGWGALDRQVGHSAPRSAARAEAATRAQRQAQRAVAALTVG